MASYLLANAALSLFAQNYRELKRGLPIRPSEMGVLNIITQTPGPHTSVLLAGLLGVSKPMIAAHLAVLSQKGYIRRQPSPEDGRAFFVLPTPKALALVERAGAELDRDLGRLEQELGPAEFAQLVKLAQRANEIMQREDFRHGQGR